MMSGGNVLFGQAPAGAPLGAPPGAIRDYLLAFGLTGSAVACRALLQLVAPTVGPYVLLLPAVAFAAIFCDLLPAGLAAIAAGLITAALLPATSLFAMPLFNAAQIDTLLYLAACAALIWTIQALRREAADAAVAEARLAKCSARFPARPRSCGRRTHGCC